MRAERTVHLNILLRDIEEECERLRDLEANYRCYNYIKIRTSTRRSLYLVTAILVSTAMMLSIACSVFASPTLIAAACSMLIATPFLSLASVYCYNRVSNWLSPWCPSGKENAEISNICKPVTSRVNWLCRKSAAFLPAFNADNLPVHVAEEMDLPQISEQLQGNGISIAL